MNDVFSYFLVALNMGVRGEEIKSHMIHNLIQIVPPLRIKLRTNLHIRWICSKLEKDSVGYEQSRNL